MSELGILIVTGHASHKEINQLLLYLRDYEFGAGDVFHLITTKNISDALQSPKTTEPGSLSEANYRNEWTGASCEEVESFMSKLHVAGPNPNFIKRLYLLLDDQGISDKTIIIGHRIYEFADEDLDEGTPKTKHDADYDKARFAWDSAYNTWCNLSIANMGWEEFCKDDEKPTNDGWWQACDDWTPDEDARKERDAAIAEMSERGDA